MENSKNKSSLITGTGQDASYLAQFLLDLDYKVYVLHRRYSHNNFINFKDFEDHPNLHFICGDVTDYPSIHNIILKYEPDEIYNLAAMSFVGASFEQPMNTFNVDAIGCINFLECLKNLQQTTPHYKPKFYQASTSELFGSNVSFETPMGRVNANWKDLSKDIEYELFQDEETPFCPESPYAVAKLAAHNMCRIYRNSYDIFVSSSILFNHGSPRRGTEFVERKITRWVAEFHKWRDGVFYTTGGILLPEEDVIDYGLPEDENKLRFFPKLRLGNLDAYRDWSHAKDMVRGMWLALQQDKPDDYVMCSEKTHSIRDLLALSFSKIGIDDWENYIVQDEKFMRPSEVPILRGKCVKAREILGWEPEYSFNDLIGEMVESDIAKLENNVQIQTN